MNGERFTGKAIIYEKYRPSYPEEFINYLYSKIGFSSECIICDIGSGTGKLSKKFLDKGSKVICVEPNDNMRQLAEKNLSVYSAFESIGASAEDTGIVDDAVEFITVAQAFHWFDEERFKAECQRILNAKGKVVLVWNIYEKSNEIMIKSRKVFKKYCIDFNDSTVGSEENSEVFSTFFRDGKCDFRKFNNNLILDIDGFIGRHLSESCAPKAGNENYQKFIDELSDIFLQYSKDGIVTIPNITRSYIGEV